MRPSRPAWFGLGLLAVAGLGAWLALGWRRPLPASPLEAVPGTAVAVASVRLRALRAAPAWRALVGEDGDAGAREIERLCGFDPLSLVEDTTVFVTGAEDVGLEHVGFVARGPEVQSARLVECVRRAVSEDGGGMRELRIEGERAIASARGSGRAAFVRSDGVAGGTESSVAGVIRALRGDEPSAASDPMLRALWTRIGGGSRELSFVAHVPASWRRVLAARLADRTELAPLLRVAALGLSARVATDATLGAVLRAASPADAQALVEAGTRARDAVLAMPLVRLTPHGRALGALRLEAEGPDAIAGVDLDAAQLRAVAGLVREALLPTPPGAAPSSAPSPAPDAVIRPTRP
jgi:hypothetical protein